jgi:uncharacterized protein
MQQYIISPYLFLFKRKKNEYLSYNGLNNSFLQINQRIFDLLNEAKKDVNVLNEVDVEIQQILKENLILCTEEDIQTLFNQKKFFRSYNTFQNNVLNLTIAPTSACNFKCFYCFEDGISHKTMDDAKIEQLIDFVVERSKHTQNNVGITWYGGEPLLAIKQITKILEGLRAKNINITDNSIITNGYLLNEENFNILKDNNVKFIQITLDGSNSETHNKRRSCIDGSGSWDKILENLDNILNADYEFQVSIRCNVGKDNQEEYQVLKEYLENRWKNNKKISIYPGILKNYQDDDRPDCQYLSDIESSNFLISQGVKNKNLQYPSYSIGGCSATQFNAYLIGPEGELYKCWNELGRTDRIVGNISNKSEVNKTVLLNYLSGSCMLDDENCKKCCLFFVCGGGCQWSRINNYMYNKNENLCYYVKANIEKYLEEYFELKQTQNESNDK